MPRKKSRKKIILQWLAILLVGGFGGFSIEHSLLPALAQTTFCQRWDFFKNLGQGTTIINRTEEIKITENLAWQNIIERALHSLVGVTVLKSETAVLQANGLILTSDGLILVPSNLIEKDRIYSINYNGENNPAKVFFQKPKSSLTLLKIEKNNLPVIASANPEDLRLGELVVLIGITQDEKNNWLGFVNQGIIRKLLPEGVVTTIVENDPFANGSILVNLKGEIIGLNVFDENKNLITVDASKMESLLQESLTQNKE